MEGIIVIIEPKGSFLKFHNNTVHWEKKRWRFSRESLVSDIPAGDGKTASLFLQSKGLYRTINREKGKYFVRKPCDGWKGDEGQAGTVVT